jgi:hypothetical protein
VELRATGLTRGSFDWGAILLDGDVKRQCGPSTGRSIQENPRNPVHHTKLTMSTAQPVEDGRQHSSRT